MFLHDLFLQTHEATENVEIVGDEVQNEQAK